MPGAGQDLLLQVVFLAGVVFFRLLNVNPRLLVSRARMLCFVSNRLMSLLNLSSMNGMLKLKSVDCDGVFFRLCVRGGFVQFCG